MPPTRAFDGPESDFQASIWQILGYSQFLLGFISLAQFYGYEARFSLNPTDFNPKKPLTCEKATNNPRDSACVVAWTGWEAVVWNDQRLVSHESEVGKLLCDVRADGQACGGPFPRWGNLPRFLEGVWIYASHRH